MKCFDVSENNTYVDWDAAAGKISHGVLPISKERR